MHDQLPRFSQKIAILNNLNKSDYFAHGFIEHLYNEQKMTDIDLKTSQQKSPELREAATSFAKLKVEWRFSDSFLEDL